MSESLGIIKECAHCSEPCDRLAQVRPAGFARPVCFAHWQCEPTGDYNCQRSASSGYWTAWRMGASGDLGRHRSSSDARIACEKEADRRCELAIIIEVETTNVSIG